MYIIVNSDNIAIASCDFKPDLNELKKRGEWAIFTETNIPLNEICVKNGKITRIQPNIRQIKIYELNSDILPKIKANDNAFLIALRRADDDLIAELNSERDQLQVDYNQRMEALLNDD